MPVHRAHRYQRAITTDNSHYNRYLYCNEVELASGY